MYIGIDLGTSGVKVILLNEQGEVVASQTEKLTVSRPHPLWSEQDPEQWWQATDRAMKALGDQHSLQDVKALGIAGQMHGATLLDAINMNEQVKEAMEKLTELNEVSAVRLDTDYNFTNTATKQYRWQAVYEITHY